MSVIIGGKVYDFPRLETEIAALGVTLRGLGFDGARVHTYDQGGAILQFTGGDATKVAQAMTAHASPVAVDYGADAGNVVDLEQVRSFVQASRTFLGNATPTNAQVLAQVQRNTRALLALVRIFGTNG